MNQPRPRLAIVSALLMAMAPAAPIQPARGGEEKPPITVRRLGETGPLEFVEGDRPILRYNHQIVAEPAEVRDHVGAENRRYAVARSDYIHPIYGPNGEVLTLDWPIDHPHHRGVYWAWPEVDWRGERGDLHALQKVFARPVGEVKIETGPDHAQITAESLWRWENDQPIVREAATIRVGRWIDSGRAIDLTLRFTAIDSEVLLARRDQTLYGGLSIRLAPLESRRIATTRRAWADISGVPRGGAGPVGLAIFQDPRNPDHPGDWVQYPELDWLQPTFPASGTRYSITRDRPLTLRYRLWIHEGRLDSKALEALEKARQAQAG